MKKSKMLTKKILLPTLLALILTTIIISAQKASPTPTITQPIPLAPGDVAVTSVVPTPTKVHAKDTVKIDVTVENLGTENETVDVYAFADMDPATIGDEITLGPNTIQVRAPTGSNTTTFEWKPKVKGNYTISGNATLPGDSNPGDNLLTDGKVTVLQTIVYMEVMSEYDYTSGSDPNGAWTNEANAWDQTDDTYATRTSAATEDNENNRIEGTGNVAPSNGPAIYRVAIGVEHHCTNTAAIQKVKLRPVFGGANLGDVHEIPSRGSDTDKARYIDVTSDTNAPSSWTWSDIQNLDVRVWGKWENPTGDETLYIDQIRVRVTHSPTINGTAIGETFTVNIKVRDAFELHNFGVGMTFNPDLLGCTGFFEGAFLKKFGATTWTPGNINNATGVISQHGCDLLGPYKANGTGTLAYATFEVKAPGVSNPHLRDTSLIKVVHHIPIEIPINVIEFYTAVVKATPYTVVTVSNSTSRTRDYHSGFRYYAFNRFFKELSFNVTSPYPGFSNVTIPRTLLNASTPKGWKVIIDGRLLSLKERTVTENATHTSIYFTYTTGIHMVQITTRMNSTISIDLSSTTITLGSNVTMSGNITAEDHTARPSATVTIQYRMIGEVSWHSAGQNLTDLNGNYTFTWTPGEPGTHEIKASWEGDNDTIGAESDVDLRVLAIYVFEPVPGLYVVIETNSTVSAFDFDQLFRQISFNVTAQYGTIGFSNVTIPKALLNVSSLDVWKVFLIDVDPFNPISRTVTENATHTSIYFTYTTGIHMVQITTRMSSTIWIDLSSTTIDLGSTVTVSGNVTAADSTVRADVNVKIQYTLVNKTIPVRPPDEKWITVGQDQTDEYGVYSYDWTPETAGVYYVTASWLGDEETIGTESEEKNLTVIQSSTISIVLSSANITLGSSITTSGSIDPLKPSAMVTIQYRLTSEASWSAAGFNQTDQDSSYTFEWEPEETGTYEIKASWEGYNITIAGKQCRITYGAESDVQTLTVKYGSTISIALSSANITEGESVTISGNITVADNIARADVTVTILYKLNGESWTTLDTVITNSNGGYTCDWVPEETGTYEIKASWPGDEITYGDESDVLTLTVEEGAGPGFPIVIVVAAVAAVVVIAAIAVYFVKFRKPK